ncbi:MAG: T9SS type A sorting domain-containing protein, partial [Bacteroidaceae bacterium]|nr:T9SS type A sorting domain-containing protein [Bacteroidaceae bacterium]
SCGPFTWNDSTYYVTGDYQQTFESIHGCDSIVTLHLTINDMLTTEWEQQACNRFIWNGIEYTETGDYQQIFESLQGCDSVVTLHLKLFKTYEKYLDTIHCGSFWFNGQEIETSGYYEGKFVSTDGCDSIVYLQVNVEQFPEAPHVEGQDNIYVSTDLVTGVYYYEATPVSNSSRYEWSLEGVDWLMDTIGTSCTLTAIHPGTGILSLKAWNECGFTEVQRTISAGFYDISEQGNTNVNVYPNPAKYKTTVESEGIMHIRMYSINGQMMKEISGNDDDHVELNLKDCSRGLHLLEVITRKGVAYVKLNVVR